MEAFTDLIMSTDAVPYAVLVLGSVVTWLAARYLRLGIHQRIKDGRAGALYDVVLKAAHATYLDVYSKLRTAGEDRKLTATEIGDLSTYAWNQALKIASDPEVRAELHKLTEGGWTFVLDQAVRQLKREGGKAGGTTPTASS